MKVKQGDAVKAYQSVLDLNRQKLSSGKIAKQIFELTGKLASAYDFQLQEAKKILELHPEFDPSINGIKLEGKNDEERAVAIKEVKQIEKEFNDLAELDVDLDFTPFSIDLNRFDEIQLSGEDIGNLEKFITFE